MATLPQTTIYTLSRPVGVKQLPGPSLPKPMAQFNTEQTGYCKTIPRPFSTQTDGTVSFCFGGVHWGVNTEQTRYCKTIPRPSSTQIDGTVLFCFFRFGYWCMLSPQPYTRTVPVLGRTVATLRPALTHALARIFRYILSRPVAVKQPPGPSLPNTDGTV